MRVTTPSTEEVPLRTATAFLAAATTVRDLGDLRVSLRERGEKELERRDGLVLLLGFERRR